MIGKNKIVIDPHTAVGIAAEKKIKIKNKRVVYVCTAHPAKFIDVLEKTIERNIELPDELKKALSGTKRAPLISKRFDDLKAYLLKGSF